MLLIDGEVYVDTRDNLIVVKDCGTEFTVYADWAFYHPDGTLKDNNEDKKYGDIIRLASRQEIKDNRVKEKREMATFIVAIENLVFSLSALLNDYYTNKGERDER